MRSIHPRSYSISFNGRLSQPQPCNMHLCASGPEHCKWPSAHIDTNRLIVTRSTDDKGDNHTSTIRPSLVAVTTLLSSNSNNVASETLTTLHSWSAMTDLTMQRRSSARILIPWLMKSSRAMRSSEKYYSFELATKHNFNLAEMVVSSA